MISKTQLNFRVILSLMLIISTICIYIPQTIYFANQAEFADSFLSLIYLPTFQAMMILVVTALIFAMLPVRIVAPIASCLLMLSLMAWIQGDLISIDIGLIDGSLLQVNQSTDVTWIVIYLLIIIVALLMQKTINKHVPFVVMLILFGQLTVTFYQISTHQKPTPEASLNGSDEFEHYSNSKNVVLIILDTFGSQVFQQIREQNPAVTDSFNGFVSYPDTISNYPATRGSIPSILSGSMLPIDKTYQHFIKHEVAINGLPKQMEERGYLSSFISLLPVFADIYPSQFRFEPQVDPQDLHKANSARLIDYALLRVLPSFLKFSYYDNGQWFFTKKISSKLQIPSTTSEKAFMMIDYHLNNLSLKDSQPRFKVLHFGLPHPEFIYDQSCHKNNLTENKSDDYYMFQQSSCALKKLNQLLARYKSLGIYDKSMIVVTSDHGARLLKNMENTGFPSFFELNTSGVLFMIKGINQQQPFKTVNNPLSLLKLYELITDEQNHSSPYDSLESLSRPFYSYRNPHKGAEGYLPDAPLYEVKSDYSKADSWLLKQFININCSAESIPFTMKFRTNHRSGYCSKHGFARPDRKNNGTWSRSVDARVLFRVNAASIKPSNKYLMKLTFLPNTNNQQPQISLKLVLNGQVIGHQDISDEKQQTWEITINGSTLLGDAVSQLQLLMPSIQSERELGISDNTRKLGIFLKSIEIIEAS